MIVRIFDVLAGACALIITDEGQVIMIDCHQNSHSGWKPGDYLRSLNIDTVDLLVITNYDEDHCSGFPNLLEKCRVRQILRNNSIKPEHICHLKEDEDMGSGVSALVEALSKTYTGTTSPEERVGGPSFSWNAIRNTQATVGDNSNNLSLLFEAKCTGLTFLFTGDMENAGWEALGASAEPMLKAADIFLAPHHGRENACWEGFAGLLAPTLTVISDKGYMYDTQTKSVPFYRRFSTGASFGGTKRQVLTTRNDGSIEFNRSASGWTAFSFDESY